MSDPDFLAAEARLRQEFNDWAKAGRGDGMAGDHANIAEGMLARMSFGDRDKILDVGCGNGWLVARLAEMVPGGQVVGIDVADEMIHEARRLRSHLENVMFMAAPAEEIPWDENFFDKVVSIESAYYWPSPRKAFEEIFRVLRPGGTVSILINLYEENTFSHQWRDELAVETHLLSGPAWRGLMEDAGLAETAHVQVPDTRPVPDDARSRWFRDADEQRRFREQGALLVTGRRPELK